MTRNDLENNRFKIIGTIGLGGSSDVCVRPAAGPAPPCSVAR